MSQQSQISSVYDRLDAVAFALASLRDSYIQMPRQSARALQFAGAYSEIRSVEDVLSQAQDANPAQCNQILTAIIPSLDAFELLLELGEDEVARLKAQL